MINQNDENFINDSLDLTFDMEQGRFNYRVGAIIIKDNKILMVKNNRVPYYYSVGGRVKLHESSQDAIIREAKEETGVDFEIDRLGFVYENFYKNTTKDWQFHGISFYYYLKNAKNWQDQKESFITNDVNNELSNQNTLCWLSLNRISKYNIVPKFFKHDIINKTNCIKHIVEKYDRK